METRLRKNPEFTARVTEARNILQQWKQHDRDLQKHKDTTADTGKDKKTTATARLIHFNNIRIANNPLHMQWFNNDPKEEAINAVDVWITNLFHAIREAEVFLLSAAYYCNCPIELHDWNLREDALLDWNPELQKECKTKSVQERIDKMSIEADYDTYYAEQDKKVILPIPLEHLSEDSLREVRLKRMNHKLEIMKTLVGFIEADLHVVHDLLELVQHHQVIQPFNIEYFKTQ